MSSKARYHINPTTMRPNVCGAKIKCAFLKANGKEIPHYDTAEEAQAVIEKILSDSFGGDFPDPKKIKKGKPQRILGKIESSPDSSSIGGPSSYQWRQFGKVKNMIATRNDYGDSVLKFDNGIQVISMTFAEDSGYHNTHFLSSTPELPKNAVIKSVSCRDEEFDLGNGAKIDFSYVIELNSGEEIQFAVEEESFYYGHYIEWDIEDKG